MTMWTVGGEVVGRISGKFGMELGVQYKGYRVKEVDGVKARLGLPALTARLALNYNYRDKLLLKAGADVYGPRDYEMLFTSYTHPSEVVYGHDNMQVDVHLGAEYNFSKNFGIFIEGRIWPISRSTITINTKRWALIFLPASRSSFKDWAGI